MEQCSCSDTTGHRTLAQLRTALLERLGFPDPLGTAPTRTLLQLRTSMRALLGWNGAVPSPPGVDAMLTEFINEAQQSLFRRIELDEGDASPPAWLTADADPTTLDWQPVQTLAMALACAHFGKPAAKGYMEQHEKYVADVASRRPPGIVALLNRLLTEAQDTIVLRYPALRTERWFTWNLTQGERFYDLPDNTEQTAEPPCTKQLNPSQITWVGYQNGSVTYPLVQGIPPELLGYSNVGRPERYEIRQCIELWPAPASTEGQLLIKGRFYLEPFAADADVTTIDDHAVYLLALANAKSQFKQADARDYFSQFEVHLQGLVAGTHLTKRYIPRDRERLLYVEPKPLVPFP